MSYVSRMCVSLLVLSGLSQAVAQGYRVEGQVYRVERSPANGRNVETRLFSSVTLFHKGRVYDYVESAEEVIIFEPTGRRFTILNTARELVTSADFDEIRHLMASRRRESERYLQELRRSNRRDADDVARSLEFQLAPSFDTKFNSSGGLLTLSSPSWTYRVQTHSWEDEDQVREYLNYADWISQLNSVLDPMNLIPEPRLLLNQQLRKLKRLPTSVTLDLNFERSRILRANHKFIDGLTSDDRHLIQVWDTAAKGDSVNRLSLRRYQEAVLVSLR